MATREKTQHDPQRAIRWSRHREGPPTNRGDYTQKRIRLNPSLTRSKIPPIHFFRREVPMPQYEFFCNACKKSFSKILTIAEHDKEKTTCPHCEIGRAHV